MTPKNRQLLEELFINKVGVGDIVIVDRIPTERMLVDLIKRAFELIEECAKKDHSHALYLSGCKPCGTKK